jgi:hypothetical protein
LSCEQLADEINALATKANPSHLLADAGWQSTSDASVEVKPQTNSSIDTATQVIAGAAPLIIGAIPVIGVAGAVFGAAVDAMQKSMTRGPTETQLGEEPSNREPTAKTNHAEDAYVAQQRKEHLTSIFNAKGC